ncbi:unnamed protein product [Candida verbasci]|uniref:Bul1 N-terminal domain-containing protein n=1 Tax=Candida verbasci TaxID=1227364 RepID=A0A9W4XDR1_9ASCO|nr:unnamed protein product [Candida verbasci]
MSNDEPEPPNEDELINNILPSYHMFQSTVSKNLTPTDENYLVDPPNYDDKSCDKRNNSTPNLMTPITSETPSLLTSVATSNMHSPIDEVVNQGENYFNFEEEEEQYNYNEESDNLWKNNILSNVDQLPNLTYAKNPIADSLKIDIQVTEKVCQKGIKPIFMDPSTREFNQGDYLHGYITIRNVSDKPIPFDMVYVVFEGSLAIINSQVGMIDVKNPLTRFKFLNMMDLFASWSYANIDRLITDNGDPHDWCDGETDPYDNTLLAIDVKRLFQPNVTYKRFFTFRIPSKLLDDTCSHNLPSHLEVPPTLGIDRNNVLPSMILATKNNQIKDLSFMDSSISYSIDARVIGKASDYNFPVEKDQYVVAKLASTPIRVIPKPNLEYQYNKNHIIKEAGIYYKAFLDSIMVKIDYGNDLLNTATNLRPHLSPAISHDSVKLRHLYDVANSTFKKTLRQRKIDDDDLYQCLIPFKKKSITGSSKYLGVISLSTIKDDYRIRYTSPPKFGRSSKDTELVIPIEISYFSETDNSSKNIPEIKSIDVELVTLTIRSNKHAIPFEFIPDMLFHENEIDNTGHRKNFFQYDNFDQIIIKKFQEYLYEFHRLIKELGNDLLKIETKLYRDVKSIASLKTKYINLPISNCNYLYNHNGNLGSYTNIKSIPWSVEENTQNQVYSKKLSIKMDLNNCSLKGTEFPMKGLDTIVLVPNFQSCYMGRLYYVKVSVRMSHGVNLILNVPLEIYK